MTKNEYNGWFNYETWAVSLWIDNEEGSYNHWRDRAREIVEESKDRPSANARLTGREPFTAQERAAFALADELKEHFEENNPLADSGVYTDLLNAALSEVNWHEIAKHYIGEVEVETE